MSAEESPKSSDQPAVLSSVSYGAVTPPEQRSVLRSSRLSVHWEISAGPPLPAPAVLREYVQLIPNAAERFLVMVEQETQYRRDQHAIQLQSEIDDRKAQRREIRFGQVCALTVALSAIIGGTIASIMGATWPGIIIGGGGLVALAAAFLRRPSLATASEDAEQKRTREKQLEG